MVFQRQLNTPDKDVLLSVQLDLVKQIEKN